MPFTHNFRSARDLLEFRKRFGDSFKTASWSHKLGALERKIAFGDDDSDNSDNSDEEFFIKLTDEKETQQFLQLVQKVEVSMQQQQQMQQESKDSNLRFARRFLFVGDFHFFREKYSSSSNVKNNNNNISNSEIQEVLEKYILQELCSKANVCDEGIFVWTDSQTEAKRGPVLVTTFICCELLGATTTTISRTSTTKTSSSSSPLSAQQQQEQEEDFLLQSPPFTHLVILGDNHLIPLTSLISTANYNNFPISQKSSPFFNPKKFDKMKHFTWNCGNKPKIVVVSYPGGRQIDMCNKVDVVLGDFSNFVRSYSSSSSENNNNNNKNIVTTRKPAINNDSLVKMFSPVFLLSDADNNNNNCIIEEKNIEFLGEQKQQQFENELIVTTDDTNNNRPLNLIVDGGYIRKIVQYRLGIGKDDDNPKYQEEETFNSKRRGGGGFDDYSGNEEDEDETAKKEKQQQEQDEEQTESPQAKKRRLATLEIGEKFTKLSKFVAQRSVAAQQQKKLNSSPTSSSPLNHDEKTLTYLKMQSDLKAVWFDGDVDEELTKSLSLQSEMKQCCKIVEAQLVKTVRLLGTGKAKKNDDDGSLEQRGVDVVLVIELLKRAVIERVLYNNNSSTTTAAASSSSSSRQSNNSTRKSKSEMKENCNLYLVAGDGDLSPAVEVCVKAFNVAVGLLTNSKSCSKDLRSSASFVEDSLL